MKEDSSQINLKIDSSILGLKIYIFDSPAPWNLVIHSQAEQGWATYGHDSKSSLKPLVATTLLYKEQAWAIRNITKQADGSLSYFLEPWPEYELWVHQVLITEGAVTEKISHEKEKTRMEQLFRISLLIELCMGWLPAQIQEQLSTKWYFYPPQASSRNGLIEAMFGMEMCLFGLYFRCIPMLIIGPYMTAEGIFRMLHCLTADKPLGVLPVEFLYRTVKFLTGLFRSTD